MSKVIGVDELFEISGELFISGKQIRAIDHFTDSVLSHLDEEELDDATRGEQDSLAAADESFGRINP